MSLSSSSSSSLVSGHLDTSKYLSLMSVLFPQSEHTFCPLLDTSIFEFFNSSRDISLTWMVFELFISSTFCAATKAFLASSVRFQEDMLHRIYEVFLLQGFYLPVCKHQDRV